MLRTKTGTAWKLDRLGMGKQRDPNLQDTFLAHIQQQTVPVTVFLLNGVRLQGYITHFDKYGVSLTRDRQTQFVYKHAISSIDPLVAVQLTGSEEAKP